MLDVHGRDRLIVTIALHARDGFDDVLVLALPPNGIAAVQRRLRRLGDKELARISVASSIGHGETSGHIEGQRGRCFILVRKPRPLRTSSSIAQRIASLNLKSRNDAVKREPVEKFISVLLSRA